MSIKEGSKRASRKLSKGSRSAQYVVPESTIREFVEKLGILDIEPAALRFLIVADATRRILEQPIEQLNPSDLRQILRVATESKNRRYQRIMKAIVSNVGQGPDGIKRAHLTARLAVEIAFKWTRDYVLCFKAFEHRLRGGTAAHGSGDTSERKSGLRLASCSH